jgi:hypothetical protein
VAGEAGAADRVEISKDAFLKRTGQLWKLVVAVLVLPLPTAVWGWWCMRSLRSDQPTSEAVADLAVLVVGALIIVSLLASVRCPKCHTRLVKNVLRAPEGADAITSFMKLRSCPSCGYAPDGVATAP